jgi:hypothetical protein
MAARGFNDLMRRRAPRYFYAFDLLWKDGQDLRGLPLIKRKRLLKKIVKSRVLFVDHLVGHGVDLFQAYARGTWRESSPRRLRGFTAGQYNLGEDQGPKLFAS